MNNSTPTIPTQAALVRQIDAFLERHDMKPSRLAREATGEPALVDAIRDGRRSPTLATVEKLVTYMNRVDEEARLREKLDAPVEPAAGGEADDPPLPFSTAPVNPTGASSPTSSSTSGAPTPPRASGSCPSCSCPSEPSAAVAVEGAGVEPLVAGPSQPTRAGK